MEWEYPATDRIAVTSTTLRALPSATIDWKTDQVETGINTTAADAATATAAPPGPLAASTHRTISRKRGISYNSVDLTKPFEPYITWTYDWGFSGHNTNGIEYVSMLWDWRNREAFVAAVGNATSVLSFDEPDLDSQADIDPQTAAQVYKEVFAGWTDRVRVGSPAISNGQWDNPPMGTAWLARFFELCDPCPVDFVAFHWYGSSDEIDAFCRHLQAVVDFASRYGVEELWLTEFGVMGDPGAQASFMSAAVMELESTPKIGRYAAFMASEGTLLTGGASNAVGEAYVA